MKKSSMLALAVSAGLSAAACGEKGMTYGDWNSIIAVAAPDVWERVDDVVYAELERTVQTVRDEKTFTVTYQEPYAEFWDQLRNFRQLLMIGTMDDPWIQEAIEKGTGDVAGPGIHQLARVWSREQTVTLVVLPEGGSTDGLAATLDEVYALLDRQFLNGARQRMYISGVDSALADTLAVEAGFRLLLPDVYRRERVDSVFIFRNDNPDPSELIRQITVTWRSPAPGNLGQDGILAWRQEIADTHYVEPQEVVEEGMQVRPATFDGRDGMSIQTQWRNPPDRGWPAGGPLITRTLTCDAQDRTYLLDAWLYAPGKEKYEYMVQLETILDTFDCGR